MVKTAQVFQHGNGNAREGREEEGGSWELEERLAARGVLLPPGMDPGHPPARRDRQLSQSRRAAPLPGGDCLPQASGKNFFALSLLPCSAN